MTATLPIRSSLPAMAAIALTLLLSACGGSDERSAKAPAKPTGPTSPAAGAPAVDDADAKLANAVATGKTRRGLDEAMQSVEPRITKDVYKVLTVESSVASRFSMIFS